MSVPKLTTPWLNSGDSVVCFGDSLTEDKNGYVSILQRVLGAKGITVINSGLGGDKTPAALTRLNEAVLAHKPTAVSILFGGNDCIIGRGQWRDEPIVSPTTFEENLKWIIHLCRLKANIQKFSIIVMNNRMEGQQFLDFGDCRPLYCQAARRAADATNAVLVPLDSIFADLWVKNCADANHEGLLYTRDGLHMNPVGNQIIADSILRAWNLG